MPKTSRHALSRYSQDALLLLGQLIREARVGSALTAANLAERAGISRSLLQRIEKGDPGCAIGSVFEVAAVVGLPLFDSGERALAARLAHAKAVQALLPKAVRPRGLAVKDDF